MFGLDCVTKCLAIGIAITLGTFYFFQGRGITWQDAASVGLIGLIMAGVINCGWPQTFFTIETPNEKQPLSIIPQAIIARPTVDKLHLALRTSLQHGGAIKKFYINSYLDNHIDNQIWQGLILEHHKDVGQLLQPIAGQEKANHLVKVLNEEQKAFEEVMEAALSENPNRIKEALKNLYFSGNEVADALYQLNSTKLSSEMVKEDVKKCNDLMTSMVFSRLEQNWSSDAKTYYKFQVNLIKMADQLSEVL